ncbi:MAG TPA: hypothetical protein DCP08_09825 [Chloroflexi bacterium]|nr:hypothetical protein [Chloroflexota bacterium]
MMGSRSVFQIPWEHPHKIEVQSIIDALVAARGFAQGYLVDIGCGSKPYLAIFASRVSNYIGVDLPHSSVDQPPKADIYADAQQLPFKAFSFDTALSTQVLEHLVQPREALLETHRVLKPGGVLIMTAPQTWGLHEEPRDYYRFTRYGLQYLAESCGFHIEYVKPRRGVFALMGQSLACYLFRRGDPGFLTAKLVALLNRFFARLDSRYSWEDWTLGYILVARKTTGGGDG